MAITTEEKARLCCKAADDKKAVDLQTLDVRGISDVTDIFMITTATSSQHAQTIAGAVEDALRGAGEKDYHIEGYENAQWILIDASDLVAHVFTAETRAYYGLEKLWADAPKLFAATPEG